MSEHWKSTPKYWCKHCSTYVKDTPFEKKQHEATGKHQGNLRRFLNGIQKDHAKNEREKNQAKAEVERLNRIAGASSSTTTATTSSGSSSSQTASKTTKANSTSLSAADQKRQWAQLADMGIAVPENAGVDNATPGGWQTVSRKVIDESPQSPDGKLNIGVRKRKFDNQEEEEEAGETVVRRGWGSTTKTYPGSAPTHNDLDALLAASVFKKESFKQPADEDSKQITSSIPEFSSVADDAENGQETKPIPLAPLEHALSGTSSSAVLGPFEEQDKSLVLQSSGLETAIPVFKKRKPRK